MGGPCYPLSGADRNYLMEQGVNDPDIPDRKWRNIELIAHRDKQNRLLTLAQREQMSKALNGGDPLAHKAERMHKAVMTGGSNLGTGYQGTEATAPQNRQADFVRQYPIESGVLWYYLTKKIPRRDTRTLTPNIIKVTDAGYNPYRSAAFSESGTPSTRSYTAEENTDYRCKLLGTRVDRSFLVDFISQSSNIPPGGQFAMDLSKITLPQEENQMLWTGQRLCSRLAGAGSDYLEFDGALHDVVRYWKAAGYGTGTLSWIVVDMAGAEIKASHVETVLKNLADVKKGQMAILRRQMEVGDDSQIKPDIRNIAFIMGQTQYGRFQNEFSPRYITQDRTSPVGYTWNGQVHTQYGTIRGNMEGFLDGHFLHIGEVFALGAPSPSDCAIAPPANFNTTAGAAAVNSYFDAHSNDSKTFYYWVCSKGPTGRSAPIASAANAIAGTTVMAGQDVLCDVSNPSLSGIDSYLLLRSETNDVSTAAYVTRFPVVAGLQSTYHDDDLFMPGHSAGLIFPMNGENDPNPPLQICNLTEHLHIQMAMDNLNSRDAFLACYVPIINNQRQVVTFINVKP